MVTSSNSETTPSEPTVQGGFEGSPKQDHPVGASVKLSDAASETSFWIGWCVRRGMRGLADHLRAVRNQALEDAAVICAKQYKPGSQPGYEEGWDDAIDASVAAIRAAREQA